MDGGPAVGAAPFEDLSADGAEPAAHGILLGAVGLQQPTTVDKVGDMRWAKRIRAVGHARSGRNLKRRAGDDRNGRFWRRLEFDTEFLRDLLQHIFIQFRAVALLDHRNGRLLATELGGKAALRQARGKAGRFELAADFWTQIDHASIMDFLSPVDKTEVINIYQLSINLCTRVDNSVDMHAQYSVDMSISRYIS